MPLFNPHQPDFGEFDAETRRIFEATIEFFEDRGKRVLKEQDRGHVWYADFLDFVKRERVFATLLTPAAQADGDPDKRWDTARVTKYSQILGFYGMAYWYVWQVSILGLGPIWQSGNEAAKRKAAGLLDSGAIFAFGLSERAHGADVYTTDMVLTPDGNGGYRANGGKYYIGNGNQAGMVSVFGRVEGLPTGPKTQDGYVFFVVDSRHPAYKLHRNVVDGQMYVAAFDLEDYPVREDDILHLGSEAFDAAINTVNVGKFNLGFGAIGAVQHGWHEAITHDEGRVLFDTRVTDFAQVRALFLETWVRLAAMDLYSERAVDYMRSGTAEDRRYLLVDAIEKMNVTRQAAKCYELMADAISAKGFENDMYFPMGATSMMGLPRLEGTVHVNMALALKFLVSYLFSPTDQGPVIPPRRRDAVDDAFLFHQGPAQGLDAVSFHDWRATFADFARLPNVKIFLEQVDAFQAFLGTTPLSKAQMRDLDLLLVVGDIFTAVPYAELILQQASITGAGDDILDSIFEVLVRDVSGHALTLSNKPSVTPDQQKTALACLRRPAYDAERSARVWAEARATADTYAMKL
ncbi:acyl-CoA dehydrogenase family protein [Streptomyces sp. V3I7]|uniref:acyl-CoA dehydrogenase family protein n=1 Tax=Streptomyces sp. V3I7 TaxID=3042278 RepID=UPI0027826138|nr:acyl-CoA dehydrogenase family protein [Streptomyces sp. V3I7]MDQ0990088.1 acyl-CoA dehydrogenase [Streptomyces sp. V3I7]